MCCAIQGQTLNSDQLAFNSQVNSVRVIIEHAIGRIKHFKSMKYPWRHPLYLHGIAFFVCTQLAVIKMRLNPIRYSASIYLNTD